MLYTTGGLVLIFLALLLLARVVPGSGAQVLDWKPTRSYEAEAELELDDIDQMLEAQNARRRASGRAEMTMDDVDRLVKEDESVRARARPAQERMAEDMRRSEGALGDPLMDELDSVPPQDPDNR